MKLILSVIAFAGMAVAQPVYREYITVRNSGDAVDDIARVKGSTVTSAAVEVSSNNVAGYTSVSLANTDASVTGYCDFDSSVTAATGWPVEAGSKVFLDISSKIPVWCIAASSIDFRVMSFK